MTVTLDDIRDEVRAKIGRGTALDAKLDGYIQRALRHIERRRNWPFMYSRGEITLDAAATTYTLTDLRLREIDYLRIIEEEGVAIETYVVINKSVDMSLWEPPITSWPTKYFLQQDNVILFNNVAEYEYTIQTGWWAYTTLTIADDTEHWLFDNAQDLVEDLACYYAAKGYRDFQRAGAILATSNIVLDDLVASAEDHELGDAEMVMQQDHYYDQASRS